MLKTLNNYLNLINKNARHLCQEFRQLLEGVFALKVDFRTHQEIKS